MSGGSTWQLRTCSSPVCSGSTSTVHVLSLALARSISSAAACLLFDSQQRLPASEEAAASRVTRLTGVKTLPLLVPAASPPGQRRSLKLPLTLCVCLCSCGSWTSVRRARLCSPPPPSACSRRPLVVVCFPLRMNDSAPGRFALCSAAECLTRWRVCVDS